MPRFFGTAFDSSGQNRKAQRGNGAAEIITNFSTNPLDASTTILAKIPQAGVSLYSVFMADIRPVERVVHGIIATLALAQLALAITMLATDEPCEDTTLALCKAATILRYLCSGVILAGWVPAEAAKMVRPDADDADVENDGAPQPAPGN